MKKLVVKTAALTLSIVILFALFVFGAVSVFAPKSMATFFDRLDCYSISVYYYESQYNKTEDYEDLNDLCIAVDEVEDSERAYKYLDILCGHVKFPDYDGGENTGMSYQEYFYAKYASSALIIYGENRAIEIAEKYVKTFGETKYNPFVILGLK